MISPERRYKTEKKIKKRIRYLKSIGTSYEYSLDLQQPHRLHKWNLTCAGYCCKLDKKTLKQRTAKKSRAQPLQGEVPYRKLHDIWFYD